MNKRKLIGIPLTMCMIALGLTIGCRQDDAKPEPTAAAAALPNDFFLAAQPADAKTVEEVKKSAKPGDIVTVRGLVGGSVEPFVEGRAVFTLMGNGLKPCGIGSPMPDCKTPWDYCCDPPDDIAAHSATIQVVDANGAPLKASMKGQHKIKELSDLVVVGKVNQAAKSVLVINATKIFVR